MPYLPDMGIERRPLPKVTFAEVRALKCPRCFAKPGDPCRNQEAKAIGNHGSRVEAAGRAKLKSRKSRRAARKADPRAKPGQRRDRRSQASANASLPKAGRAPSSPTSDASAVKASSPQLAPRTHVPARLEGGRLVLNASDAVRRDLGRDVHIRVSGEVTALTRRTPVRTKVAHPEEGEGEATPTLLSAPCRVPDMPRGLAPLFTEVRLSVEMVPKPLWELSAKKWVPADQWKRVRDPILDVASGRCQVCDAVPERSLECHEVWAYDDARCVQRLANLMALCPDCHAAKTPGRLAWLASTDVKYAHLPDQAREHLATVNGWALRTVDQYVRWCVRVNAARGAHAWTQDLTRFFR